MKDIEIAVVDCGESDIMLVDIGSAADTWWAHDVTHVQGKPIRCVYIRAYTRTEAAWLFLQVVRMEPTDLREPTEAEREVLALVPKVQQ